MRLNLSSQINIIPVHGENPWLKGDIEWTPGLLRSALAWLSEKTGKSILKLTDKDYKDNSLGQLLDIYGSAYDVNIRVFNDLQHTITGWPGGKPNADDSDRCLLYTSRCV